MSISIDRESLEDVKQEVCEALVDFFEEEIYAPIEKMCRALGIDCHVADKNRALEKIYNEIASILEALVNQE